MSRPLTVFVDVDDTLVRSFGSKRIAMSQVIARVRELYDEGACLYCWSSGGGEYAQQSAEELGIKHCFQGFLPKPHVAIDDVRLEDWRELVQIHPNEAPTFSSSQIRSALRWPTQ